VSIIDGYDVVTCGRCGFAYADGIPDQRQFDAYYRDLSKYEYHQRSGEESDFDRARMDVIASIVAPLVPTDRARILDIGCASGRLLYLLARRGFPNVLGLDPSAGCVDTARRLYDVEVLQGHLGQFPTLPYTFDVVILVGVLEHIRDVSAAMTRIRSLTTPRGLVYVEVPDALEFSRWPNAPFQDFSVEHINFFSPLSLANLFAVHGFEPVFVHQDHRVQAYRTIMSNISAAFRLTSKSDVGLTVDSASRTALQAYIAASTDEERRLREQIDALVTSQRAIIVWGVGTNATRLLNTSRLGQANITAFVDSNAKYHGKTVAGRPIVSPETLLDRTEPILIVSRVFQTEIARQIRDTLGQDREIMTLYEID
jgi:SAM-dependent methyltransferase